MNVGDEGTVQGPSDPSTADAHKRVRVDMGEGKGSINFLGAAQLEGAPLAGGWQKGDRVRVLVGHAPQNVKVGDEGTVQGPCNDPSVADAHKRVCVDMGEGKGRVNLLGAAQLEGAPLAGGVLARSRLAPAKKRKAESESSDSSSSEESDSDDDRPLKKKVRRGRCARARLALCCV